MKSLKRWTLRAILAIALILATLVVGGAVESRSRNPDLKPWHRVHLDDVTASDVGDSFSLTDYLAREETLFAGVRVLEATIDASDRTPVNRYNPASLVHPLRAGRDWNRTFELEPTVLRGGVLLVHGLTDSPYSMRAVSELLRDHGFYTLGLRMPGHGTLPSGLTTASWQDWLAATRMGVRHVRQKIGAERPLVLVGYSNGGALVLKYTLDAVAGGNDPVPSRLVLLSPMLGVTPAAWLSWWISRLGVVPYFEKANWLDVIPEYNPFKYNSFPTNAAFQTASITRALERELQRMTAEGRAKLPPILTFQSSVDATVSTAAIVERLYDRLPGNGSELVLFDVNQVSGINVFVRPEDRTLVGRLFDRVTRPYRRVLVTNADETTGDVVAREMGPGATEPSIQPLGLKWPPQVFSLTHVAIPFPTDDELYGLDAVARPDGLLGIGRLSPRGERAVLTVGTDTLMRLSSNPFFPFMADRISRWVEGPR